MTEITPRPERVDVGMLEQQQPVVASLLEQGLLQRVRVAVAHPTQPAGPEGAPAQSSASQSRVSIASLTARRNAAA